MKIILYIHFIGIELQLYNTCICIREKAISVGSSEGIYIREWQTLEPEADGKGADCS